MSKKKSSVSRVRNGGDVYVRTHMIYTITLWSTLSNYSNWSKVCNSIVFDDYDSIIRYNDFYLVSMFVSR